MGFTIDMNGVKLLELRRIIICEAQPYGIATDSLGNIYVAEVSFAEYGRRMDPPKELRSLQKLIKTA